MGDKIIIRQFSDFRTEILATDPEDDTSDYEPVEHVQSLTPFGMLLASLGACTTILLHSYSQQHGVDLDEVEMHLRYADESETKKYGEKVYEELSLKGDLKPGERDRLHQISKQCSIHKLLEQGIEVHSTPA